MFFENAGFSSREAVNTIVQGGTSAFVFFPIFFEKYHTLKPQQEPFESIHLSMWPSSQPFSVMYSQLMTQLLAICGFSEPPVYSQ